MSVSVFVKGMHHPLYGDLAGIVGPTYCSDADFVRMAYSRDTSPAAPIVQGIVVRPGTQEEVISIVKLANYTRTPIVPSGGRASIYGVPPGLPGKGIVIDMTRLRRIVSISEEDMVMTAEAGMNLGELNTKMWERGWDIHTAAQPWYADTVGGILSGVPGGGAGIDMTSVGWNIRELAGLKVCLPTGDVVQTGCGPGTCINLKQTYASEVGEPYLTGLFVGDGGVFGIKLEASLRMVRAPKIRQGIAAFFDKVEDGFACCQEIVAREPVPVTMMGLIPPTPTTALAGLDRYFHMCVCRGYTQEEVDEKHRFIRELWEKYGGKDCTNEETPSEWLAGTATMQKYREMGEFATLGCWTYLELMAPGSQAIECHRAMKALHHDTLNKLNIKFESNLGITMVTPNMWLMTSIIFLKGYDDRAMAVMKDLWKEGLEMGAAHGWCPDANQGLASIIMGKYWPAEKANFMRTLKKALDPNNIMNPGLWGL